MALKAHNFTDVDRIIPLEMLCCIDNTVLSSYELFTRIIIDRLRFKKT